MGDHPVQNTLKAAGAVAGAAIAGPVAALGAIGGAKLGDKAGAKVEESLAPDLPAPVGLPDAPTADDPAVGAAADRQRKARGLASTILTSRSGSGSTMLTTSRKTLLGD